MGYKSINHAANEFVKENRIKNAEVQKKVKMNFIAAIEANYINYDEIIDIESNGAWVDREDENFDNGRMEFIEI